MGEILHDTYLLVIAKQPIQKHHSFYLVLISRTTMTSDKEDCGQFVSAVVLRKFPLSVIMHINKYLVFKIK